jgi:hypothetical protein
LLSGATPDHDRARDLIAALITRHRGEYVFRIGSQPPRVKLYSGEAFDEEGWTGISRTPQEVETLQKEMTATVEEVGGKVQYVFHHFCCVSDAISWKDLCSVRYTDQSCTNHSAFTIAPSERLSHPRSTMCSRWKCRQWEIHHSRRAHTRYVLHGHDVSLSNYFAKHNSGALDDGRGRARVGLFRHKHEI